jgi:type I restriction enzyme S subunit
MATSQGFANWICGPQLVPEFLQYLLLAEAESLEKFSIGTTIKTIYYPDLKAFHVCLPPLPEQKRIVALLDEAFAGIDEAKAKAETSQHDAEELISEHVRSTFSDAGIEWRETTLGEAFDVRDGTHDSPKYHTTGHPLVTSKNLKREGLSFEDVKLISKLDFAKINERSAVSKGDVLFAMIGTIGNPTLVEVEPDFAIKNVALFKNRNGQSGAFLKHYLNSSMVVRKMMKEAKGTTQRFVGLGYLRSFPIKLPPIETQLRVVREINDIEGESQNLTRLYGLKYAKLDDLKQSFLSQAFAGELTA